MPSRPQRCRARSALSSFTPEPLERRRLFSVAAVEMGASAWSPSFRGSLQANGLGAVGYRVPAADVPTDAVPANLPWNRLDQVSVKFDVPADDAQFNDLLVSGVRVSRYAVADMAYDPATFTATWTLGRVVSNDKLLLRLRTAGGVFQTRVNVLAGDVNQSGGVVNGTDLRTVQSLQVDDGTGPVATVDPVSAMFCDVDGSGAVDARDVTTVRARLLTHLPYREPQLVLPEIPTSDGWLGTVMNANHYIASEFHLPRLSPRLSMITDLTGADSWEWVQAISRLRTALPNLLVGMYHSARDAQYADTLTKYPPRAVPREGLTADQILMPYANNPAAVIVDYSQPAARQYLVDHIVRDVVRSGRPLAYLDNVSHNETGFPLPWAMTMALIRDITTNLHAMGKRAIVNAAWVPGYTSMESVDQFIASGADGIALEMGFYPFVRNNPAKIHTAMAQYRKMLDAGLAVTFVPNAAGMTTGALAYLEAEQRLQAAFAMMFRKPGDRLFVSQIFWRPSPDWTAWPEQFGAALGEATIATNALGQVEMTRPFTNYTLKLNTATGEVSAVPAVRAGFAPVERGAQQDL